MKQVSGPMDRSRYPMVAAERSRSRKSKKDLVTGPIRGFCALHRIVTGRKADPGFRGPQHASGLWKKDSPCLGLILKEFIKASSQPLM
jgi:hypothetical protein